MSINFIHTADVHLGSIFKKFNKRAANIRRLELKNTFYNILEFAKKQKVDFIFISGDLFEEDTITINELNELNEYLSELNPIQVCMIAGNHDAITDDKSFYNLIKWSSNVHILDRMKYKIFEGKKTIVYGYSWNQKLLTSDMTSSINILNKEYYNILLAHGDIYGSSKYMPINKQSLIEKQFDYVALGHIHKYDKITDNIVYSGSPEALNFGEEHTHGIIYGRLNKDGLITEFIPTGMRNYITTNITIDNLVFEKDIISKISSIVNDKDIFRVIIEGAVDEGYNINFDYITEYLNNNFFHVELVDEIEINWDIENILKEHNDDIIGGFIKELRERNLDDETYKKVLNYGLTALFKEKGINI